MFQSVILFLQRRRLHVCMALAVVSLGTVSPGNAESQTGEQSLKTFLQSYLRDGLVEDTTTKFSAASISLDEKTQMELVYLSGKDWCGTGGCTAFLLSRGQSSFKIIQKFTLVRLPIRVLCHRTKGWNDLVMWVRGGGGSGHTTVMRFNGSRYPSNPSSEPVATSAMLADCGQDLSLDGVGERLYP